MDNDEETIKKFDLISKYSGKPIPKFLKFIGKINELDEFEDWVKETKIALLNWFITYLLILPFIIFFCLSAIGISISIIPAVPKSLFLAEGISLFWYLILEFKKDLWRK